MSEELILFEVFPELKGKVPYLKLGDFPTPVQKLVNLSQKIASKTELYIKRDDLSSQVYGGNKVRKLEFTLANILRKKKKRVLTGGGLGSHMTLAVAAFCREHDLKAEIVLFKQPLNDHVRHNLLLDKYLGADMHYSHNHIIFALQALRYYLAGFWKDGQFPYLIFPGNSNIISNLGYVSAVFELKKQIEEGILPEPDYIFVGAGTCGTAAGLLTGLKLAGLKSRLICVQVVEEFVTNEKRILKLAQQTYKFLLPYLKPKVELKFGNDDVLLLRGYLGECYGDATPEACRAIELLTETEQIRLETTYTGKVMAAVLDFADKPANQNKSVLFINTYNSRDYSNEIASTSFKTLPAAFQQFF